MKVTETVEVPAKKVVRTAYFKCELCERTTTDPDNWPTGQHMAGSGQVYDILETTVELREGYSYPGDYSAGLLILDICPKCFKEKLIPWFQAQGGTVREERRD